MMKKLFLTSMILSLCLLAFRETPKAATNTGIMDIWVEAQVTCAIIVYNLDFGIYTGDALIGNTTVNVNCASGTAYTISYDQGLQFDPPNRQMLGDDGTAVLPYTLTCESTQGSGLDILCGDGVTFGDTSSFTSTGALGGDTWNLEGAIPPGAFVPPQMYWDTIIVTLTY